MNIAFLKIAPESQSAQVLFAAEAFASTLQKHREATHVALMLSSVRDSFLGGI